MIIAFVTAAAVAAAQAPAPPPIAVTNVPPPPIITAPIAPPPLIRVGDTFPRIANISVRIRALAGRAVLLDDRFRVGRSWASFNQSRSEAGDQSCPLDYAGGSARTSFSMSLRPQGMSGGKYQLSSTWLRPSGSCQEQGSRSVSIEQGVVLKPGQTVVVEGDGGLRLELTQL